MTLYTENIVKHKESGNLYECTCSEKDGIVSVREIESGKSLTGGFGMFETDHYSSDFEKVASSKLSLKKEN